MEAFVSARKVEGRLQYLVKWSGFGMVGEEAAYTWEWASSLQQDLRRPVYRDLVARLRGGQPGASANSTLGNSQEGGAGQRGRPSVTVPVASVDASQ